MIIFLYRYNYTHDTYVSRNVPRNVGRLSRNTMHIYGYNTAFIKYLSENDRI